MATIPGLGRKGPTRLTRVVDDAIFAVADRFRAFGFGTSAVIHGSAATRRNTFLDVDGAIILMSDVDVLLRCPISFLEVESLQGELSRVFSTELGAHSGPNSRVSIKCVTPEFLRTCEAASLLRSAGAAGVTANTLFERGRATPCQEGCVDFPFAMPYSLWHWI